MSNRKIKLIWDFRGPDAEQIAKHHCVHLKEFSDQSSLSFEDIQSEVMSEFYCIASLVVNESDMIAVRDLLKPHRGEVAKRMD